MNFEKFIVWCDKVMAFSFYALIYFLPISIALSEIFTVSALVFYLLKRGAMFFCEMKQGSLQGSGLSFWRKLCEFIKAFKPIDNYLNWPITIFLLFNIISVILSQHQWVGIEGFLGKSLQSAFLYFTFIECINSKKRLKIFLTVLFISILLICTNGLYQNFTGQGFVRGHIINDGRISSSFRAHNDFAGYLIVVIPILLSLSLLMIANNFKRHFSGGAGNPEFRIFLSKRGRFFTFILFLLSLSCLGFTYSRGAWIAFALVLIFVGFQGRRNLTIGILVFGLFFGIFYPQLYQKRHVGLLGGSVAETVKERIKRLSEKERKIDEYSKKIGIDTMGRTPNKLHEQNAQDKHNFNYALGFGTGDFTIDFWINFIDTSGNQCMIHQTQIGDDANNYWDFFKINKGNRIMFNWVADGVPRGHYIAKKSNMEFTLEAWTHIAFVRNDSQAYLFINGVSEPLIELTAFGDLIDIPSPLYVGMGQKSNDGVYGYIDDFRITKGEALWTRNFTPPKHLGGIHRQYSVSDTSFTFIDTYNLVPAAPPLEPVKNEQGVKEILISFIELQQKKGVIIYNHFSGSGRMKYWQEAINMIKDYPVFGVGLNTYSIVGRGYKINWGGYPHNCYLQMAVEIGIVGLLSFLWIIFVIFRNSLKNLKIMNDPFLQLALLGALAGYYGFLVHSFFDTNFYSVQLGSLLWLVMGIIIAVQRIENA